MLKIKNLLLELKIEEDAEEVFARCKAIFELVR